MTEAERRERQAAIQAIMLGGGGGGGGVTRADFLYALERSNPSCRWDGATAEGAGGSMWCVGREGDVQPLHRHAVVPTPSKDHLCWPLYLHAPTNALVTLGRTPPALSCHPAARLTWSATKHLRRRMAAPEAAVRPCSKGCLPVPVLVDYD